MERQITRPTTDELARIEAQRDWVRCHYEPEARHKYDSVEGKLRLIQAILDANWIEKAETVKLQSLGIAFGDALAQQIQMEWVTVEDDYGKDPALRIPGRTAVHFPLTAISKRIERGEQVDVQELFQGICQLVHGIAADPDLQAAK